MRKYLPVIIAIGVLLIGLTTWVVTKNQQQQQAHLQTRQRENTNTALLVNSLEPMNTNLLTLTSPAFENNAGYPVKYTCDGAGVNPPLEWSGLVPPAARSFALILEDPDVPSGEVFDHWVVWDIPKNVMSFAPATTPPGVQGKNSAESIGYTPPCPPDGEHRYIFKLYMLNIMVELPAGSTKAELLQKMADHVMATSELIGRYDRQR